MSHRCTIGELSERVAWVLSLTGADQQRSGRITAVPDVRTLRYYTTRGLLAPPEEIQGRTAFYGRRHLVQAVAIKRLQSHGESLNTIQQRVVGATDRQLEAWAKIPDAVWDQVDKLTPGSPQPDPAQADSGLARREVMGRPTVDDIARDVPRSAFWESTPRSAAPKPVEASGQPALQWELAPGIRVTWDDARQAEVARHDPHWQRALDTLAVHAARIRQQAGDDPS